MDGGMRLPTVFEGQYTLEELLVSVVTVTASHSQESLPVAGDVCHLAIFAMIVSFR
jgi:hypothetical protein